MTLEQQFNHMRKLSAQLSTMGTRVVYAGSGTLLSAAVLHDPHLVVEHAAYWEQVAAAVALTEGAHFMRQRRAIRDVLAADGIAARIDALVARLLDR